MPRCCCCREIGFIAHDDPRMLATSAAHRGGTCSTTACCVRYRATAPTTPDQIPGDENAFLACTFWLVQHYAMSGRVDQATALMDRMVGLANDVGLLSEEYDVRADRMTGNFPQAFSHLALVQAADAISRAQGKSAALGSRPRLTPALANLDGCRRPTTLPPTPMTSSACVAPARTTSRTSASSSPSVG